MGVRFGPAPFLLYSPSEIKLGAFAVTPDLHIEILHKEITVSMPGTSYTVTYYRLKVLGDTSREAPIEQK